MILPGFVLGADAAVVLDMTGVKPGVYYYTITVAPDGNVTLTAIPKVVSIKPGPSPTPVPTPQPVPVPPAPVPDVFIPPVPPPQPTPVPPPQPTPVERIELTVSNLTDKALQSGGSVTSAVCLQRAYFIVAGAIDTNKLSKEKTFEALKAAADIVVAQSKGGDWQAWRNGVSKLLADASARGLSTKEEYSSLLRRVEQGLKNTVNTTINFDRSKDLSDSDYAIVVKVQQKIIDELKKYE